MLFQGGITPGELGNLTHDQLSHVDADAIAQIPVSKIQVSGARLFEKKLTRTWTSQTYRPDTYNFKIEAQIINLKIAYRASAVN